MAIAAVFEITFAMSIKYSEGFTQPLAAAIMVVAVIAAITFLTLSMKLLPVSVAYPIWIAIGTLGTIILGYLFIGDGLSNLKIILAAAIIAGVAGLYASAG